METTKSDEENEPPTCNLCGAEYDMPDGYEPTEFCNDCAHKMVTILKAQNERLVKIVEEAPNILCNVAQLLDGWHNDGTCWSEWDESVRKEVSRLQTLIEEAKALLNEVEK